MSYIVYLRWLIFPIIFMNNWWRSKIDLLILSHYQKGALNVALYLSYSTVQVITGDVTKCFHDIIEN